jgi:hypothetical protein
MLINFEDSNSNNSYSDFDGSDREPHPKKKISSGLAFLLLIIGGTFLVQNTLAANISLNSGKSVEFGQGIAFTSACSGSDVITVTPFSNFTNSSGAGTHYLNSIKVSGIPSGCNGSDFNISVYDSTTSTALAIFNSNSKVAVVYNNAGTFEVGRGGSGSTVTSGSGTFTVTFGTPVALASNVARITIQSGSHVPTTCLDDGVCVVGLLGGGPGGGTIFYYNAAGFSAPGTTCSISCHYLEWNQTAGSVTNQDLGVDAFLRWSSDTSHYAGVTSTAIGAGFANTQKMLTNNGATGYMADTSGAAYGASRYGGTDGSIGQWFLPSFSELELMTNSSYRTAGGLTGNYYWSSSEDAGDQGRGIGVDWGGKTSISWNKGANFYVRYVRAF